MSKTPATKTPAATKTAPKAAPAPAPKPSAAPAAKPAAAPAPGNGATGSNNGATGATGNGAAGGNGDKKDRTAYDHVGEVVGRIENMIDRCKSLGGRVGRWDEEKVKEVPAALEMAGSALANAVKVLRSLPAGWQPTSGKALNAPIEIVVGSTVMIVEKRRAGYQGVIPAGDMDNLTVKSLNAIGKQTKVTVQTKGGQLIPNLSKRDLKPVKTGA